MSLIMEAWRERGYAPPGSEQLLQDYEDKLELERNKQDLIYALKYPPAPPPPSPEDTRNEIYARIYPPSNGPAPQPQLEDLSDGTLGVAGDVHAIRRVLDAGGVQHYLPFRHNSIVIGLPDVAKARALLSAERSGADDDTSPGQDMVRSQGQALGKTEALTVPLSAVQQAGSSPAEPQAVRAAMAQRSKSGANSTPKAGQTKAYDLYALEVEGPPTASDYKAHAEKLNSRANYMATAAEWARSKGDKTASEAYQQEAIKLATAAGRASLQASNMNAASQGQIQRAPPAQPFAPGWNTGEYSAGMGTTTAKEIRPDYVAINGSGLGGAGTGAVNTGNGKVYIGGGGAIPLKPSANVVAGYILGRGGRTADERILDADGFLKGGGTSFGGSLFGGYLGVNHSLGGKTAIEIGVGTPGFSRRPNPGGSAGTGFTAGPFNDPDAKPKP